MCLLIFAQAVSVSLSACQTTGSSGEKFSPAFLKQNIKVGVTTPADIRKIYGTPDYTSEGPNGPSAWNYNADKSSNSLLSKAASYIPVASTSTAVSNMKTSRTLTIFFDKNRVSSYSLSDSKPR